MQGDYFFYIKLLVCNIFQLLKYYLYYVNKGLLNLNMRQNPLNYIKLLFYSFFQLHHIYSIDFYKVMLNFYRQRNSLF